MADRITQACLSAGAYTISVGTMHPTIVLARLLDTLAVLDPAAHGELLAPGGEYASIPRETLRDAEDPWWETEAASRIVQKLVAAINEAAPKDFCCVYADNDRIELAWCGETSERGGPIDDRCTAGAPASRQRFSAVRTRVRTPKP